MTERSSTTDALVLRGRPLGEADRVYILLTRERGKVDAVAKGVRRPRSSVGGRLEPLAEVRVTLHRGRSLDVITEVRTIRSYWNGLVRPDAFATASLFAETVDLFCEPELALPEIYALLAGAIGAVAASDAPATLVPRFQLRWAWRRPPTRACTAAARSTSTALGSISKAVGWAASGAAVRGAMRTRSHRST